MHNGRLAKLFSTARLLLRSSNQLFWPAICVGCRASVSDSDNGLCRKCWDELLFCTGGDYCPRCGRDVSRYALVAGTCANCHGSQIYFDGIARTGVYFGALGKMILAFKAADRPELARNLCFLANSALQAVPFVGDIDFFVPVPLHWTRRLVRGYNQSYLVAKKLKHPSATLNTDLVRIRHTRKQVSVAVGRRAANVAGAFAVRRGHRFAGRCICLVDDIKTTGATLNECARTLKQAGAREVYALVLAVAGQSDKIV